MIYDNMIKFTISIHALREESDIMCSSKEPTPCHISIHALREESDIVLKSMSSAYITFQSTLSVRRATYLFLNLLIIL